MGSNLTPMEGRMDNLVGWFVIGMNNSTGIVGPCCASEEDKLGCPVYAVNIHPYNQTCADCGLDIFHGAVNCCVLFEGKRLVEGERGKVSVHD
jgi:hypothetical protein